MEEVGEKTPEMVCMFQWDDESKMYLHASSGFYYEPNAGWYYSSRDGLYYRFESGTYVPLEPNEDVEYKADQCDNDVFNVASQDECIPHCTREIAENPPPPSEWLEETLIDFYLTGYSNSEPNADSSNTHFETNEEAIVDASEPQTDDLFPRWSGGDQNITPDETEGELIREEVQEAPKTSGEVFEEDAVCDEERWQTQYGQVLHSVDNVITSSPIVDLWDWRMIKQSRKEKLVARLVGRLVRGSKTLHPSMPTGGHLLRTAAICETHLDLVRVSSGKVYRLRTPSVGYLASLTAYDSSDPTKGWGFPDICANQSGISSTSSDSYVSETGTFNNVPGFQASLSGPGKFAFAFDKHKYPAYRDRASERRALHGGFGVGPGQKNSADTDEVEFVHTEEAAAEAINLSFGAGSYARRILESMGWKEGEALGRTTKGLLEPLQAVGNKGSAGLGWNRDHQP